MRIRTHWSSTLILLPLLAGSLALLLWSQPKAAGQSAATLPLDRMPVRIESGSVPAAPLYGRKKTGEEYVCYEYPGGLVQYFCVGDGR